MAKKTAAKKPRRRLKRTARRSLAAVLMITAVVVAAIPVPENVAADPAADDDDQIGVIYEYKTDVYDKNSLGSGKLARPTKTEGGKEVEDTDNIHKTHYIQEVDGMYQMEWEFEFFLRSMPGGNTNGIICGYNSEYPQELLKIPTNPVYDYYVVWDKVHTELGEKDSDKPRKTFEEFKTEEKNGTKTFTCQAYPNAAESTTDAEFQKYFPEEYKKQLTKANGYDALKKAYDAALEKYKKDNPAYSEADLDAWKADNPAPDKPEELTLTPGDFSDEDDDYVWRLYYCDTHSLKGYILTKVVDRDRSANKVTVLSSYVPKRIDMATISKADDDDIGFRADTHSTIIGIGDEVFGSSDQLIKEPVRNVNNIYIPKEIKYIGDYAFAGSFIQSITIENMTNVGNYAFKECPKLNKVTFVSGITNIGKEAFYGVQNLREIAFPGTTSYIGPGAFAECSQLSSVDFSALSLELTIDDYAFYNDVALNKVNFVRKDATTPKDPNEKLETVSVVGLGKGAFAVRGSVTGGLTEFLIPQGISQNEESSGANVGLGMGGKGLGDYLLAGRTNLQTVWMSENYGSSKSITLPDDLFFNCISLSRVIFPSTGNSCGFVKYKKDLFDTVSNLDFAVWGPKYLSPSNKVPASPRESTWAAESAVSKTIPYVYFENGVKYVEISDDIYLECINDKGVLISCTLKPGADIPSDGIDLVIPADVAGIIVTEIGSNCFSDNELNQAVKTLTILDDSRLAKIGDGVFAGWGSLQKVYIGNSVRELEKNVFLNDKSLTDITFNTPASAAKDFKVGTDAFKTTGLQLTFHGVIDGSFAPYRQAVSAGNYIDDDTQTMICYKSQAPSSLTVMYDNASGKVTLLDYPKYEDVETILGEWYATKKGVNWKKWKKLDGTKAKSAADFYRDWMERDYYAKYSSEQFNPKRDAFETAWKTATDPNDVYNNYEIYGPWIDPYYCEHYGTSGGGSGSGGGGGTPRGGDTPDTPDTPDPPDDTTKAVFDWLFEPITAYAMPSAPKPYFEIHPYSVFDNNESTAQFYGQYQTTTGDEFNVIDATENIEVPDGVTSIDVKGFLEAKVNNGNVAAYFTPEKLGRKASKMYRDDKGSANEYKDREKDVISGLFSGEYEDYERGEDEPVNPKETVEKGNDRLKSIDLNGVVSLPRYAFDSCENLEKIMIGKDCLDIGTLPFRGCTSLTNVVVAGDNPKYLTERNGEDCKRIIYSRNGAAENGDALYKIEECLETRGKDNDISVVDSAYDNLISRVSALAEGAFASCDFVEDVYLTDATHLSVIPERSFMDCAALDTVELPSSVNKIEEYAFYNADMLSRLRIPGREVSFTDYVFEDNDKRRTDVVTYADSAARRYADTNAIKYNLRWDDIGDLWEVKFFDMDGVQVGSTLSVPNDTTLKEDQKPQPPEREGYVFDKWIGTGGITDKDPILAPTNFIAKYNYNSSGAPIDGKYMVEFHDGVTGEQLAGRGSNPDDGKYYVPVGKSFADMGWPEPSHLLQAGYEPAGFSSGDGSTGQWTQQTAVNSNLSIIALYKVAPNGGGDTNISGGTTNTSGGATNTSGGTTSTKSSSSTSTTSSSTSSSSTSTSSSTSDGAGVYTVFVENGSGSGTYAPGATVIIQAAIPAAGMKFSNWTTDSNGVTLASASMAATTFTMPSNNVTVKANYVEDTGTAARTTGAGNTTDRDNGSTRVDIEKPGISNRDLATANVNGSTDNFIVKISETDEATRAVAAALTNKYGTLDNILYYAMDISLYDSTGTTKISDTTGLTVDITIPIPDSLVAYGGNNKAGAVVSGDQLESLNENFTTINGVPCIRFRATHFSPYTIYVDTGNLVEGMLDTTPKTGDPIHPKWFLSLGLACLSVILFMKKDRKAAVKA